MTKAIKNVSDEVWSEFKALAGLNRKTMGQMFEEMVADYKRKSGWLDKYGKPLLKDPERVERRAAEFRKNFTLER